MVSDGRGFLAFQGNDVAFCILINERGIPLSLVADLVWGFPVFQRIDARIVF